MKITAKIYTFLLLGLAFMLPLAPAHAVCTNNEDGNPGVAGEIEYFTADNALRYCDDTNWVDMVFNAPPPPDASTEFDAILQFFANALDEFRAAFANQFFAQNPAANAEYVANAVNFDGSTDYLNGASNLNAATKLWTGSFWIRPTGISENDEIFTSTDIKSLIRLRTNDNLFFRARNSASSIILNLNTPDFSVQRDQWNHVIFSFDLANTSNRHVYINGINQALTVGNYTDDSIDPDVANFSVGANLSGGSAFTGDMADLWIDYGTYIDLSVEANRRQFISGFGYPADLGSDGSTPTGAAPDIFLSGNTVDWHLNDGNGNGFTENGALTDGTNIIPYGLVGHWKLDETSGTTAADSSGRGNSATMQNGLTGASTTNGINETALTITDGGSNHRIQVTDLTDFDFASANAFTVAGWVKTTNANMNIFRSGDSFNNASQMSIGLRAYNLGSQYQVQISDGSATRTLFGGTRNDGVWEHIAATWDGTNLRLYENGIQVNSGNYPGYTIHNGSFAQVYVGSAAQGDTDGDVDEVYAYNRALTATEITALYNLDSDRASLIGHYELDETSGTTAADSSPYGNDGTMGGGLDAANDNANGVFETAFNFDGIDDSVSLTAQEANFDFSTSNALTISAWIKTKTTANVNLQTIFSRGATNSSANNEIYSLEGGFNNNWEFGISDGTTIHNVTTATNTSEVNTWQHIVGVWDGNTQYIYLNGVLANSAVRTGFTLWNGDGVTDRNTAIGNDPRNFRFYFGGSIDDLRVYNTGLTAADVEDLYNQSNSALVGHYKLDETSGTTAADSTPNGNDGTVANADFITDSVDGIVDTALNFTDATADTITITNGTNFPTGTAPPTTISWWLKGDSNDYNNTDVMFYGGDETANNYIRVRIDSSGATYQTFFFGGNQTSSISPPMSDGEWRHMAFVQDATNTYHYVDGVLSATHGNTMDFDTGDLTINSSSGAFEFNGAYDDVRIYNRALTTVEIQEIYNTPNEALIGHWKLDETSGTTAFDSSINGNDITLTEVSFDANSVNGVIGDGLNTNIGDASTGLLVNNNGAYSDLKSTTFSFWVNPDDLASGSEYIDIEDNFRIFSNGTDGLIFFSANAWNGTNGSWNSGLGLVLTEGQWNHVAVTYDYADPVGTAPVFYINGVANASPGAGSVPTGTYVEPPAASTYISRRHDSSNSYVRGQMDDVRIYNRTLSGAEILELYNSANAPLVAHYKLDETSGTTATDSSGNGYNGSMFNGLDFSTSSIDGIIDAGLDIDASASHLYRITDNAFDDLEDKNGGMTYAIWVRPNIIDNFRRLLQKGDNNIDSGEWELVINSTGQLQFSKGHDTTNLTKRTADFLPLNEWSHVALAWDGSSNHSGVQIFINGSESSSYAIEQDGVGSKLSDASETIAVPFQGVLSETRSLDGQLDDLRIYDRVLTAAEIADLVNNSTGGLVAHYRLDETTGTTAEDSSINGNDGTMDSGLDAGNDRTDGPMNSGLDFDGINDVIIGIPYGAGELGQVNSFAFWARLDKAPDNKIGFGRSGSANIVIGVKDNQVITFGNAAGSEVNGGTVPIGEWVHLATIRENSTVRHYINGVAAGSGTLSNTIATRIDRFGNRGSSGEFFDGQADDLRIYNRALSAAEILALFNAGDPPVPDLENGLVAYYKLDETSGTTASDSSGNGFDGTMAGSLTGASSVSGIVDNALTFNENTGDRIDIPNTGLPTGTSPAFSMGAWVRVMEGTPQTAARWSLGYGDTSDTLNDTQIIFDRGADAMSYQVGDTTGSIGGLDSYLNKWMHILLTFDGTTARLYKDGAQISQDNVANFNPVSSYGAIGGRIGGGSDFNGNFDEVRMYNRALSPTEIEILASCTGPGSYYYNFSNDVMQWCDGVASAKDMGASTIKGDSVCNAGSGFTGINQGALLYNPAENIKYYCDGRDFVPIGKKCSQCGGSASEKVAFVTQASLSASTLGGGGAAAADSFCQNAANAAGLSGTYKSWIADSDPASAPASSFSADIRGGAFSIVMPDGTTIAPNWAGLIDGTIDNNLNITAAGTLLLSNVQSNARTNVDTDGTQFSATEHCSDFGSGTGSMRRGDTRFNDNFWTSRVDGACNNGFHLYCFEQ